VTSSHMIIFSLYCGYSTEADDVVDEEGNRKESKGDIFKHSLKALFGIGRSESERMAEKEEEVRGRDAINRDANGRRIGPEMMPSQPQMTSRPQMQSQPQMQGHPQMVQQPQTMPAIPPPAARGADLRNIKTSEDTEYITSQRPGKSFLLASHIPQSQ
jgi:hypothetical protein